MHWETAVIKSSLLGLEKALQSLNRKDSRGEGRRLLSEAIARLQRLENHGQAQSAPYAEDEPVGASSSTVSTSAPEDREPPVEAASRAPAKRALTTAQTNRTASSVVSGDRTRKSRTTKATSKKTTAGGNGKVKASKASKAKPKKAQAVSKTGARKPTRAGGNGARKKTPNRMEKPKVTTKKLKADVREDVRPAISGHDGASADVPGRQPETPTEDRRPEAAA